MLTSNRFTNSLSDSTKKRLKSVLNNRKPMTRRERNHGAVIVIQTALSDLNKGYMVAAQVDGYYGSITTDAVEMFQRDYGLFADGIVGRQTLLELDQLFSSDLFRELQGMSIHVGVNKVDPVHYGDENLLTACVNDAQALRNITVSLGYDDILLTNEEATTANFTSAMRQAAINLFSGDHLFISFSGHGSQVTNNTTDEEADFLDETLCFYDRMFLDDEMYALLSELRPGVQVTALYDSCHSGTVSKMMLLKNETDKEAERKISEALLKALEAVNPDLTEGSSEEDDERTLFIPFESKFINKALLGDNAPVVKEVIKVDPEKTEAVVRLIIDTVKEMDEGKQKVLRAFESSRVYLRNIDLYTAIKSVVGSKEQEQLECAVVALSACQDNQTTLDGVTNGLFTGNVLSIWNNGEFKGSYKQIHSRLVSASKPSITPTINTYGGNRAQARLYERPFLF